MKKAPLRWVRLRGNGLPGEPEMWELRRNGLVKMRCQQLREGTWFWYGCGVNNMPNTSDLRTAKAEAKAYMLKHFPEI